ncbi:MAG: hypothetical protein KDJ87_00530 [Rhizobiaceae bacterium]|nr:hypothetical protein [Rhizobiaceae bacterium]
MKGKNSLNRLNPSTPNLSKNPKDRAPSRPPTRSPTAYPGAPQASENIRYNYYFQFVTDISSDLQHEADDDVADGTRRANSLASSALCAVLNNFEIQNNFRRRKIFSQRGLLHRKIEILKRIAKNHSTFFL